MTSRKVLVAVGIGLVAPEKADSDAAYVEAESLAPAARKRPASAAPMAAAVARRRPSAQQPAAADAPLPSPPPQPHPQKRPASRVRESRAKHPRTEADADVDGGALAGPVVKKPAGARGSSNFCVGWKQPQEGSEEPIQQDCQFSTAVSGAKVRSRAV